MSDIRFAYRLGARVRVRDVDMYGMCGRDLHPDELDNGAVGYVIAPTVRMVIDDGDSCGPCDLYLVALMPDPDVRLGDTRVRPDVAELAYVLKRARVKEFVDYELEPA